jgi:predicted metal-dependent phosphoesterase TrpH
MRAMTDLIAEAEKDMPPEKIWSFAALEEARDAVHAAGGVLLLAHPALYLRGDRAGQLALIRGALDAGLDGFELWHPANAREAHFVELLAEGRRLGCALSGGSDAHADGDRPAPRPYEAGAPGEALESIERALAQRRG